MSSLATRTSQDIFFETKRIFEMQRDHQWVMKACTADQRRTKLQKLKSAVEGRGDEIVAAVQQDTRKPEAEIRVTDVAGIMGNFQTNIDNLGVWMKPVDVAPSMNAQDKTKIVYEARGVCLIGIVCMRGHYVSGGTVEAG